MPRKHVVDNRSNRARAKFLIFASGVMKRWPTDEHIDNLFGALSERRSHRRRSSADSATGSGSVSSVESVSSRGRSSSQGSEGEIVGTTAGEGRATGSETGEEPRSNGQTADTLLTLTATPDDDSVLAVNGIADDMRSGETGSNVAGSDRVPIVGGGKEVSAGDDAVAAQSMA